MVLHGAHGVVGCRAASGIQLFVLKFELYGL
jgi:hypothetical protein